MLKFLFCFDRGNHLSNCSRNYYYRKFSGGTWALASTFHMDLLLCSKVCFSLSANILHSFQHCTLNIWILIKYEVPSCLSESRTKRLGWVLKILLLFSLPLPLLLWPITVIAASILGGIAYGFFAPLIATFEFSVGEGVTEKVLHCLLVSLFFDFSSV